MSKYFTIYLPVDEMIEEGDVYWNPRREMFFTAEEGNDFRTLNTEYRIRGAKAYQKVGLHLCSRDVQVGDYIDGENPEGRYIATFNKPKLVVADGESGPVTGNWGNISIFRDPYKIIGRVSPNATWVNKEKMEFEEDDIHRDIHGNILYYSGPQNCSKVRDNVMYMYLLFKHPDNPKAFY